MELLAVRTRTDQKAFLHLPLSIYRNDPNWCRPLDQDIEYVFDKRQNRFFRHGELDRWLLLSQGKPIGRIAAFINYRQAFKEEQPTGGIGFFECIDNRQAAFQLFDQCKSWLASKGMQAMDGPINFGERDAWWGLLVEGFTPVPYKMNYNPPYYRNFFEEYGFQNYFEQWCFSLRVADRLQEKFYTRHAAIASNPDYSARHLQKNQLEKFASDFCQIYNKAWAKHGEARQLEHQQVMKLFLKMKPVMDEKIIWFAYYRDEPVGMWINLPDINSVFRTFHGQFGLFEKIRLLLHLKRRRIRKMIGLVFGIVPEHQGKGVDAFLIMEAAKVIQGHQLYNEFEMQWIGDFNPRMIAIARDLGTWCSRKLITYRYLFDRTKPFKRHPVI
jgi:hypothetical protein